MSKNQNEYFIKNLDLQKAEEEFEQMMKEMEEDKKNHDFSIPKEWDDDFRAAMDEVLENKAKKKGINVRGKFAMAAGLALVIIAGTVVTTETVQGNRLLDIFGKTSETQNERFEMYGTEEQLDSDIQVEENIISFTADDISELYDQIREEKKRPIFRIDSIPVEYEIELAEYDKSYNIVNVQLSTDEGWIFMSYEERLLGGGLGNQTTQEICAEVWNSNLQSDVLIYEGGSVGSFSFSIQADKDILYVYSTTSLELSKEIASAFVYN